MTKGCNTGVGQYGPTREAGSSFETFRPGWHREAENSCPNTNPRSYEMSLVRLLPAWFHAIADYAVGALLIVAALAVGGTRSAVATGVVVGAVVLAVSMFTKYPLGLKKVLPFTLHSAGDYLAATLLFVAPFALSFNNTDSGLTALYIAVGAAVVAVSLITNYQYGEAAAPVAPVVAATTPRTRANRPLVADRSARAKA